jgi:hypothetical protein
VIRRVVTLCFALLVSVSGPLAAAAQNASPVAGTAAGPVVGAAVSWIGNDGTELAKVTVTKITDPVQDYDPGSPPQRGSHFVLLAVAVVTTGTTSVSVSPNSFSLVDGDGFAARATDLFRTADSTAAIPDLQVGDLAPGASISRLSGPPPWRII